MGGGREEGGGRREGEGCERGRRVKSVEYIVEVNVINLNF